MQFKNHQSPIERINSFTIKVEDLIREIVIQNDIPYYRIESMVEHHTHAGAEETYVPVIRIITYFEDTVNKVSHVLHEEFDVDIEKSVNKKRLRIETFSYKHINYSAALKMNRRELTEYKRLGGKKFEIQISSMLQDAWSGIEKELGYDTGAIPDEAKRDFYRVGALLEMADIEFLKIRSEITKKYPNLNQANIRKHEAAREEEPIENLADANTFIEHLQAVAQVAAPAPQPEVQEPVMQQPVYAPQVSSEPEPFVEYVAPVQQPVYTPPVAPEPETIIYAAPQAQQPVYTPPVTPEPETIIYAAPQAQQPVYTPPVAPQPEPIQVVPQIHQPVFSQPIAPQPEPIQAAPQVVEQPVYAAPVTPPPVMQQPVAAMQPLQNALNNIAANNPIAPQRAMPATGPVGIAPKPIAVPHIVGTADMSLDSLKALAESINHIEPKIEVAPQAPAPIPQPQPQPQPVAQQQPQPQPVAYVPPLVTELPKTVPVQEVAPFIEKIAATPPPIQQPSMADNRVNNAGSNGNGIEAKANEIIRENGTEKTVPFYEELPKAAKAMQLDENAQMTDITLREYVKNSKLLKEVDQMIAERAGAKINADIDIEGDVERLRFLKVYTLKQLHDRISDNKNDIVAFAEKWIGKDNGGSFDSGICLFYLEYLLVGKRNDPAFAVEYVVKFISDNDYSARYIIPTYNSIHNVEAPNFSHLTLKA